MCGSPAFSLRKSDPDLPGAGYCFDATAADSSSSFKTTLPGRWDYVVGLHKYTRHSSLSDEGTFWGVVFDLVTLVLLITHRQITRARGDGHGPRAGSLSADGGAATTEAPGRFSRLVDEAMRYGRRLLPPLAEAKKGSDVHVLSFLTCLALLAFIFCFFATLPPQPKLKSCATADVFSALSSQVENNQFDGSTVVAVLICALVMVFDRIIYRYWEPPHAIREASPSDGTSASDDVDDEAASTSASGSGDDGRGESWLPRAPTMKLALHCTLTIALHWSVFFSHLPAWHCVAEECDAAGGSDVDTSGSSRCFRSPALIAFYLLSCLYLWLSARQIRCGFPLLVFEHPLTDASSKYKLYVHNYLVMPVPFLWEARCALDWMSTGETSLTLVKWLKVRRGSNP